MSVATPAPLTIAPPGAVCQVCRGACAGELTEAGPGLRGETWYIHADYLVCALVTICMYRAER